MRILQGNLHRSRLADDILRQLRLDLEIDLLVISEQYRDNDGSSWFADALSTAAIWIPDIMTVPIHGANSGFVWMRSGRVTFLSCCFTPNELLEDFYAKLNNLEDTIRDLGGELLVAGDFNAKAVEWGMPSTGSKGRRILEVAARLGLNVMNVGGTSTFRRPGYGDYS